MMHKTLNTKMKVVIVLLTITLFPFIANAQAALTWDKQFTSTIKWQELNYLGNLVVCSSEALMGVDNVSGDIHWSKTEHADLDRQSYQELANSPFFTIEKNNAIYLIDQLSGDQVFNSIEAGIAEISDYYLLYNSNAIVLSGLTSVIFG